MRSTGHETGLANCRDVSSRVCWKAAEAALMDDSNWVCAGVWAPSEESVSFHFSNLDI